VNPLFTMSLCGSSKPGYISQWPGGGVATQRPCKVFLSLVRIQAGPPVWSTEDRPQRTDKQGFLSVLRPPSSVVRRPSSVLCPLSARRLADRVGHGGAAGAERLVGADRGVAGGLVLDLRIELGAEQDDDGAQPHPHHQADCRAE